MTLVAFPLILFAAVTISRGTPRELPYPAALRFCGEVTQPLREAEEANENLDFQYLALTCSRKPGYTCFTVDKIAACRKGFKPAKTYIDYLPVVCFENGPHVDALKKEILQGEIPNFTDSDSEPMLLNIPRKCLPKREYTSSRS